MISIRYRNNPIGYLGSAYHLEDKSQRKRVLLGNLREDGKRSVANQATCDTGKRSFVNRKAQAWCDWLS